MTFEILYDKQPLKFLKKLEQSIARRILDKIENILPTTPIPHEAKSIISMHGVFRLRIDDFRALYRVNYEKNTIVIFKLDLRKRVYE